VSTLPGNALAGLASITGLRSVRDGLAVSESIRFSRSRTACEADDGTNHVPRETEIREQIQL
jgi:hypothetical protein